MARMTEQELASVIEARLSESDSTRSDESAVREKALLFYDGGVDLDVEPNRSEVVSCDLADVVDWTQAGLLRVFTSGDKVVMFIATSPENEAMAKQATDAINYLFKHEMDGYRLIKDGTHDGLLHGNGILKVWWEGTPEYETEWLRGLTEEELDAVAAEPGVDNIEKIETYLVGPNGEPIDDDEEKSGTTDAY